MPVYRFPPASRQVALYELLRYPGFDPDDAPSDNRTATLKERLAAIDAVLPFLFIEERQRATEFSSYIKARYAHHLAPLRSIAPMVGLDYATMESRLMARVQAELDAIQRDYPHVRISHTLDAYHVQGAKDEIEREHITARLNNAFMGGS